MRAIEVLLQTSTRTRDDQWSLNMSRNGFISKIKILISKSLIYRVFGYFLYKESIYGVLALYIALDLFLSPWPQPSKIISTVFLKLIDRQR